MNKIIPHVLNADAHIEMQYTLKIREALPQDRKKLDQMQFALQKYFSEIDSTKESLPYKSLNVAHQYMQKMLDDASTMNGKIFVAEKNKRVIAFIQGVIIEHKKGADPIYDLSHMPTKEGWIGLLYVEPEFRGQKIGQKLLDAIKKFFKSQNCTHIKLLVLSDNTDAIAVYKKNNFIPHDLEMILEL